MSKQWVFLGCSVLFFSDILKAQSIYFPYYHYESENGLIHLNVLAIHQDKNKVLYSVTQGGVYEFSGKSFQKKQMATPLKNIRNVYFNDTSFFIVHRDQGIFYQKDNRFIPLFTSNPFKKPCDKIILHHNYCFNYTDQISVEVYDYKNKIYYNDSLLLKDNSNQAFCIQSVQNKIIVGRKKGLYFFDNGQQKKIEHIGSLPVFALFHFSEKHLLYIGTSGKILILNDSNFKVQKVIPINARLPNTSNQFLLTMEKNISKIVVDKFDRIWFCTQPDDNMYLLENNQFYNVMDILNIPPTLINDIYIDNFNNIWVATFNDGLYQIVSTYWESYKFIYNQKVLNIKNIETANGNVYFSTNNGLYTSKAPLLNRLSALVAPDNFFNTDFTDLKKVQQTIFSSSSMIFDTKIISNQSDKILVLPFKYFAVQNNNQCYVADITNNVLLYHFHSNKILDTIFQPSDYKLTINHLYYLNNQLFISTNKGLYIYNSNSKKITSSFHNSDIKKLVKLNNSTYILSENKMYELNTNKILINLEPYQIITLTNIAKYKNYYFLSSEEGLILLDEHFKYINHFSRKNGLISNVINDVAILDSIIVLATDKGISYTPIKHLFNDYLNLLPPAIQYITSNNDTILYSDSKLNFSSQVHDLYFHLICPNFNPLTQLTYAYKLNHSDWIAFDNSPLHFSSLSGGEYTLQIRATTDNQHFTAPTTILFKKELNLNEKKWFWTAILLSSVVILLLITYIIRKIEKRKSSEKLKNIQQMNLLKHQAMNAILSPHFIFNSLTGIQNYILKNDVEKASDYLSKFSRLIRMIIEKASSPTITLQDELKRIQFYLELEKERFEDKFDYEIIVNEKIDTEHTHIPNMIIQPYLENAILHGILQKKEKGHLSLKFDVTKNNFLEITIEDDGIGIIKGEEKKPKHHKSLATQTIAEILNINSQLYQKHQSVEIIDKSTLDSNSTGTIVKILIQL